MNDQTKSDKQDANILLGSGAGLAAFSVGTALATGFVCPLCVVAAPVLLGAGIVGRVRAARRIEKNTEPNREEATHEFSAS